MGTSQKKEPNVSGTEKELTPDQTLGLVSLSLMQKLSQKDPSFSWLEEDKIEKVNLKNLRDRLELTQLAAYMGTVSRGFLPFLYQKLLVLFFEKFP